ncbi:unnamed protein product, partial [Heterosigma akashiwo]
RVGAITAYTHTHTHLPGDIRTVDGRMGCTNSKGASRLESGAVSSAASALSAQDDARVAANPVAQANKGKAGSVQNRLSLGADFAFHASIGNPNMSRKNAVVISAADLKAWERMPLYEEC